MAHTPAPIHLEGTTLEGGGQLLRIAVGLSSLAKRPININNIRGKRSGGGGLKAQHLTAVQWLGQACNARLSGLGLKSKEITFTPSIDSEKPNLLTSEYGEVRITQNTPGSINLVLQAVLPYILFSGIKETIRVRITGGTNVSNSPSYDYIYEVLIPMLSLIGIPRIETHLDARSWSQGSTRIGSITFSLTPLATRLPSFQLTDRGEITSIKAIVIAPKETEQHFRDELQVMFEKRESRLFGPRNSSRDIEVQFEDSRHEKRYYVLMVATSSTGIKLGRDWLYDQGVRSGRTEKIVPTMVKQVSSDLIAEIEHEGCVDEYMRDQLVVFQALADGTSRVFGGRRDGKLLEPSLHARTAMWVVGEILGVKFDESGDCEGVGFSADCAMSVTDGGNLSEGLEALKLSSS